MIDKLFLSIVITLLLGLFLNTNLFRAMPLRSFSAVQQDRIQTADQPFRPIQTVD